MRRRCFYLQCKGNTMFSNIRKQFVIFLSAVLVKSINVQIIVKIPQKVKY